MIHGFNSKIQSIGANLLALGSQFFGWTWSTLLFCSQFFRLGAFLSNWAEPFNNKENWSMLNVKIGVIPWRVSSPKKIYRQWLSTTWKRSMIMQSSISFGTNLVLRSLSRINFRWGKIFTRSKKWNQKNWYSKMNLDKIKLSKTVKKSQLK